MSHILFQDFCIFCIQYLGRLWYGKVLSEPLATIEQYRISFNRNTMVVNDHFMKEGHLWQRKKIQFSIEKFHWSKKLRKTENFSFTLNIKVPLESVNLFLNNITILKKNQLTFCILVRHIVGQTAKLNRKKILVYSIALQCKKVQSSIEKFHWSKKLRKTENFSFKAGACFRRPTFTGFCEAFLEGK